MRRGFSLIEALVAIFVVVAGMLVVLSVFAMSSRHATLTRDRFESTVLADNVIEECLAHRYGQPEPPNWNASETIYGLVDGVAFYNTYSKTVTYANGSFVGRGSTENFDEVTIRIYWTEGSGPGSVGQAKAYMAQTKVWRRL